MSDRCSLFCFGCGGPERIGPGRAAPRVQPGPSPLCRMCPSASASSPTAAETYVSARLGTYGEAGDPLLRVRVGRLFNFPRMAARAAEWRPQCAPNKCGHQFFLFPGLPRSDHYSGGRHGLLGGHTPRVPWATCDNGHRKWCSWLFMVAVIRAFFGDKCG